MKALAVLFLMLGLVACEKEANRPEAEETPLPTLRAGDWEHGPLSCRGYHGVVGHLDKVPMEIVSETEGEVKLTGSHENFHYEARWDKSLETIYTIIKVGEEIRFMDTTRVPTENHNDTFGEARDEKGFRLGISCAFLPKSEE